MTEPTVVVGEVTKVHGLRGELLVKVYSEVPDRFASGATVFCDDGRELTISSTRSDRDRLLVSFEGVVDRASAVQLRGMTLVVPVSWLPELPDGRWWPHELRGCEIVTESGRSLGPITDVVENPANDLWIAVDLDGNETMVPALREVVLDVDLSARRVLVRDVPGLTAPG
ncbi:MAG: ribosome maturation factor RimM [Actinomycetota bacterium]